MLRERYSKVEFEKIFQSFNDAVYRGEMDKLNYKSWRNIKNWLSDERWTEIEVSKEWVRIRDDVSDTNPYAYHDEERIFVGPYDPDYYCPNPEELDPEDKSLGTWLDGVLNSKRTMANLSNSLESLGYSVAQAADSCTKLSDAYYSDTTSGYGVGLLDNYKCAPYTIDMNADSLTLNGKSMKDYIQEEVKKIHNNEKENNKMLKFDFGPVDSSVHMSMYGMAIKNASGTYVAYDANSKQIMDVDILNFEGANKFIYKMPTTLSQIAVGDVVIHARKPMFVQEVREDNRLCVMDIFDGEEKTIVPAKSPFGFDFVTKVVSLFNFNGSADASNPFGNMLPLLLLSDSKTAGDRDMLLMYMMMGGNTDFATNPMMLYALMNKDSKANDMLPFLLMGAFKQPTHSCACGDKCSCHKAE